MKFKDLIEQNIVESVQQINENSVGYVVVASLFAVSQTHIWHWLCPSGQKHMALGEFYDSIANEVDSLAEKFIAQGGVLKPYNKDLSLIYNDVDVLRFFDEYRELVTTCIEEIKQDPAMQSISDGIIDLQEQIDSALYKFKLN